MFCNSVWIYLKQKEKSRLWAALGERVFYSDFSDLLWKLSHPAGKQYRCACSMALPWTWAALTAGLGLGQWPAATPIWYVRTRGSSFGRNPLGTPSHADSRHAAPAR